ncbi:histidinol phosphate aminotransferase apoenzyme [Cyanobacterium stanieri PCC 7202]|uniref:Histidinol-phosphate aminotransferase n=1 Tax=Cyanobacterium stanieri (strain ATCC 29140 / PCC 7202) TaxID=292563 RepID=K9YIQ4_CYASC|nr:histidinol phosphate aminotransferase apoenzyme [Cyanobacterium stanieri PCC 7202]
MTTKNLSFIRSDLLTLNAYHPTPIDESQSLVRLDANESPFNLPDDVRAKLASMYEQKVITNRYPDGGHFQLKRLIAEYVNESAHLGEKIKTSHVSVGNGSDEIIRSILIATCLNGQGSILVANPTFSMYGILAETLGIPVVKVNRHESDFSINLAEANEAINNPTSAPVKVVFVVHPNSPTANCLTQGEIDWLKQLPDDILVVVDEAYYEFSGHTLVSEIISRDNWMITRTFSKAFRLAAHRVGYAIAPNPIIDILEKIRLPYNLPTFAQLAAEIAIENRDLILPSVQEIMSEKERVYQQLKNSEKLKVWHSDSNFIYLRSNINPSPETHNEIMNKLKAQNILIRHTGGGLRISIGTKEENDQLLSAIKGIIV